MLYLPLNNGLRFYRVDPGTLAAIETDLEREQYAAQIIYNYAKEPFLQPVDFADQSRVQALSSSNANVTITVRNQAGAALTTIVAALAGTMINDPLTFVHNATINWSAVTGLGVCSFVVVVQGSTAYRSEPLRNGEPGELLKLVYSNKYDHHDIGSYRNCFEMVAYLPGRLVNPEQPRELARHTDSQMKDIYLSESHFRTRELEIFRAPQYLHLIAQYALRHDDLEIYQKANGKTYFSGWQWVEEYTSNHAPRLYLYSARATLKKVADRILAITSAGDSLFLPSITILPPTGVTATGFTANWFGVADNYDVQLATDSAFANIVVSVNTLATSYVFSGLTPCQIYYYRVRPINCAGAGAWSTGTTTEQISLHFRGEQNFSVWEASEMVMNLSFVNLFANLEGVRFKYAPLHGVVIWGIYPFRTLSQIQSDITGTATPVYSVYVEVDSYAQGSEGLGILQYIVPFVRLTVGCLTYSFRGITQDTLIAFDRKVSINAVTTSPDATVTYLFVPDIAALRQPVLYDTTLITLNAQIASHGGSQYAVGVYIERALNVPQSTPIVATITAQTI